MPDPKHMPASAASATMQPTAHRNRVIHPRDEKSERRAIHSRMAKRLRERDTIEAYARSRLPQRPMLHCLEKGSGFTVVGIRTQLGQTMASPY